MYKGILLQKAEKFFDTINLEDKRFKVDVTFLQKNEKEDPDTIVRYPFPKLMILAVIQFFLL